MQRVIYPPNICINMNKTNVTKTIGKEKVSISEQVREFYEKKEEEKVKKVGSHKGSFREEEDWEREIVERRK